MQDRFESLIVVEVDKKLLEIDNCLLERNKGFSQNKGTLKYFHGKCQNMKESE
jgi:hypothetical protein